jgi:type I restriction enzyme S subunit
MDSSFVAWLLRSPAVQKRMQNAVKGVAVRGINIGDVRALQIAVPPLDEQREVVRRIEAMFSLADRLQARYANAKAQVDRLTQSVLAKAFRGELVRTEAELAKREGRTYETAEQLLARIKSTMPATNGTAKKSERNGYKRAKNIT